MPEQTTEVSSDYEIRHDGDVVAVCNADSYNDARAVAKATAAWIGELDLGDPFGFEVWQGGCLVAVTRIGPDGAYVVELPGEARPGFDRTRGMPDRVVEAFDRFFPGVLDS